MIVTIGFTRIPWAPAADGARAYLPALDGYRVGAEQDVVTLDVGDVDVDAHVVAEMLFIATSAPADVVDDYRYSGGPIGRMIDHLVQSRQHVPRAVCVGDTVTVGAVTLACASVGWTVV